MEAYSIPLGLSTYETLPSTVDGTQYKGFGRQARSGEDYP